MQSPQKYNQQQYNSRQDNKRYREDDDEKGFSILSVLIHVVFSPIIVLVVALLYFQDLRKAVLAMLVLITTISILRLSIKVIKLLLATMTMNVIGFIKNSVNIFVTLIVLGIYWFIYIAVYGQNFTF